MGYPWSQGDELLAADLNAAIGLGASSVFRSGAGVPSNLLGKDGDQWLNTTTGDVYARQGGVYTLTGNIRGPAGSTGPTGNPGVQGPPGPAGGGVSSIGTSGAGIAGGPITNSGVLTVSWNGPAVNALGSTLSAAGGTLQVVSTPPASFASLTGVATYSQLPVEVQQLPISFPFSGKPSAGALVNVPMAFAVTVPTALAGTVVYDTTKATASAAFTVNRITPVGVTTALGTVTITSGTNTSATLAGTGGSLAIGDTLQVVAPTQDASLSDVSITILAARV